MKRYSLSIGLTVFTCAVVVIAYIVTSQRPGATRLKLIPAVAAHRSALNGLAIPIGPYFVRAHRHHLWCQRPTSLTKRGIHGVWRQRFQHCEMAIGPVAITRVAAPTVSATPTNTSGHGTPIQPPPQVSTAIPLPTATPWWLNLPTAVPTATSPPIPIVPSSNDPVSYELSLMNATRDQYGLSPYSLDPVQSNGTSSCGGSIGHSRDMQASGTIWHVNAAYPQESFPNNFCGSGYHALGENVGMAGGYSVNGSLDVIHNSMMQEPHSPGCQGNHACSIISAQYTRVGIGVYTSGGATWLTVDFEG